jgi:hypothetical protein
MLTEQQKVDCRRHCGFGVYGNGITAAPPSFGYRYYEWNLTLEYRMNNLAPEEETTLIDNYLTPCNNLETALLGSSDNLDTDQAAVWYHNKVEVQDRWRLYKLQCNRLMEFMYVQSDSSLLSDQLRLVV